MDGCKVISMSDPRAGGKRFTIYRLDGRMIQKEKSIEFVSPVPMEDQWIEAFKEIGIYKKDTQFSSSPSLDDQVIYWIYFNLVRSLTKNHKLYLSNIPTHIMARVNLN